MRISVEEAVVDDLLHVMISELGGDLPAVITILLQALQIIDLTSADIFHHQYPRCRQLAMHAGLRDIAHFPVELRETLHEGGLIDEIHFLLCRFPELIEQDVDIDHAAQQLREIEQLARPAQQSDIPFHLRIDMRALHLDHDILSAAQTRPVHLRDRR